MKQNKPTHRTASFSSQEKRSSSDGSTKSQSRSGASTRASRAGVRTSARSSARAGARTSTRGSARLNTRSSRASSPRSMHVTSIQPRGASTRGQNYRDRHTYRSSGTHRPHTAQEVNTPRQNVLDGEVHIPTPRNDEVIVSRRQLLFGALGVAALGGTAFAVSSHSKQVKEESEIKVLKVPEDAVSSTADYDGESITAKECMSLAGSFRLPYGTLIWSSSDQYAACLIPTTTSSPLSVAAVLSLDSGNYEVVLDKAVTPESGWEIFDVRANESAVIWTEAHCMANTWKVYQASYTPGKGIGEPVLLAEGNQNLETPFLAIAGERVFWQILPSLTGETPDEDSLIFASPIGENKPIEVCRSRGRMASPLYATQNGIVCTPRIDTDGVYHELTYVEASSLKTKDTLILPGGMKPTEAAWGNGRFSFAFDAIYNYGEGIANLGTYIPETNENPEKASWFRFDRNPIAAPAWCGPWFVVKSTRGVSCVDTTNKVMFSLGCPDGTDDYGDYLATSGTGKVIVTYCNIDTVVQGSAPVDTLDKYSGGQLIPNVSDDRHTLVRVWKPLV